MDCHLHFLQVFIRLGKKREDFWENMCYAVTVRKEAMRA